MPSAFADLEQPAVAGGGAFDDLAPAVAGAFDDLLKPAVPAGRPAAPRQMLEGQPVDLGESLIGDARPLGARRQRIDADLSGFDQPLVTVPKAGPAQNLADAMDVLREAFREGSPVADSLPGERRSRPLPGLQERLGELPQRKPTTTEQIVTGALNVPSQTIEGLSSPKNIALLVGSSGLSGFPAAVKALVSAGFAVDMGRATPELIANYERARESGDVQAQTEALGHLVVNTGMVVGAGAHAVRGGRAAVGKGNRESAIGNRAEPTATPIADSRSPIPSAVRADTSPDAMAELEAMLRGDAPGSARLKPDAGGKGNRESGIGNGAEPAPIPDSPSPIPSGTPAARDYAGMTSLELKLWAEMGDEAAAAEYKTRLIRASLEREKKLAGELSPEPRVEPGKRALVAAAEEDAAAEAAAARPPLKFGESKELTFTIRDASREAGGVGAPNLDDALAAMKAGRKPSQVVADWSGGRGEYDALADILEQIKVAAEGGGGQASHQFRKLAEAYRSAFKDGGKGGLDTVLLGMEEERLNGGLVPEGGVPESGHELITRLWEHATGAGEKPAPSQAEQRLAFNDVLASSGGRSVTQNGGAGLDPRTLRVGDRLQVRGTGLEVVRIDADTGEVHVRSSGDGRGSPSQFGDRPVIDPEQAPRIYPDRGTFKPVDSGGPPGEVGGRELPRTVTEMAFAALQRSLEKTFPGLGARLRSVPRNPGAGVSAHDPLRLRERSFSAFEKVFRRRIVEVSTSDGSALPFNGVVLPGFEKILFLAKDRPHADSILGHEFIESLKVENPALFEQLRRELVPLMRGFKEYKARLNEIEKGYGLEEGSDLDAQKELIADFVGDCLGNPDFLRRLADRNPGLFKRVAGALIKWLRNVADMLRPFGASANFHDVETAERRVMEVLEEYAKGEGRGAREGQTHVRPVDEGGNMPQTSLRDEAGEPQFSLREREQEGQPELFDWTTYGELPLSNRDLSPQETTSVEARREQSSSPTGAEARSATGSLPFQPIPAEHSARIAESIRGQIVDLQERLRIVDANLVRGGADGVPEAKLASESGLLYGRLEGLERVWGLFVEPLEPHAARGERYARALSADEVGGVAKMLFREIVDLREQMRVVTANLARGGGIGLRREQLANESAFLRGRLAGLEDGVGLVTRTARQRATVTVREIGRLPSAGGETQQALFSLRSGHQAANRELNALRRLDDERGLDAHQRERMRDLETELGQQDLFATEAKPAADIEAEKKAQGQRDELTRRQHARLTAGDLETQKTLTPEAGQQSLFSLREDVDALARRILGMMERGETVSPEMWAEYQDQVANLSEEIRAGRERSGAIGGRGQPRVDEDLQGGPTNREPRPENRPGSAPVPSRGQFRGEERLPGGNLKDALAWLQGWRARAAQWWQRGQARQDTARGRDVVDNRADRVGNMAGNHVRLAFNRAFDTAAGKAGRRHELREYALSFAIEADGDRGALADMRDAILNGDSLGPPGGNNLSIGRGGAVSQVADTKWGRRALKAIDYADSNWDRLQPVVDEYKRLTTMEREMELNRGVNSREWEGGYVHHSWAEVPGQGLQTPGGAVGGSGTPTPFRRAREFPTWADGIAAGGIPKSLNAVELLVKRVSDGQRKLNEITWLEGLKRAIDPVSGEPLVMDARRVPERPVVPRNERGTPGEEPTAEEQAAALPAKWVRKPEPGYVEGKFGDIEVDVRRGFDGLLKDLTEPTWFRGGPIRAGIVKGFGVSKSATLLFDTFHLGRLAIWKTVLTGTPSYGRGLTLLDYTEADIRDMAARGEIPEKWTDDLIENKRRLDVALRTGLNVGGIVDNLNTEWVKALPGIGRFNHWLFREYQRGAVAETWLMEFNRVKKSMPDATETAVARQVSKDLNLRFGNLGRQGWMKSKTMQDLARLVFLAPQWNEGLIRSEIGALGQILRAPVDSVKQGRLVMGTLGKATGTLIVGTFIANQILNYITRGKPTWENEEEGWDKKISAYIPDQVGTSAGFFLNPLALPAEYTHMVNERLHQSKDTADAVQRILNSRLSSPARSLLMLATRKDVLGKSLRPGEVTGAMARALIPVPIGAGAISAGAKQLVTGEPSEQYPGQFQRQMLSSVGVKTDRAASPEQRVRALARDFNAERGIVPSAEFYAGDYEDLVKALRIGNTTDARDYLAEVLKKHTAREVFDHFKRWQRAPYTGQVRREGEFMRGLTAEQRAAYLQSREARAAVAKAAAALLREESQAVPR